MRKTLFFLMSGISLINFTANASLHEQFTCEAGDMTYTVMISPLQPGVANVDVSVSEMMDQSLKRQFMLKRTNPKTGVAFTGIDARLGTVVFSAKDENSGKLNFGNDTISCGFDSPYYDQGGNGEQRGTAGSVDMDGRSLGGNLRRNAGPGEPLIRYTSLGEDIRILDRSSITIEGRPYFKVLAGHDVGYMKGKNICGINREIRGTKRICSQYDVPYTNTYSSDTGGGYSGSGSNRGYNSSGNDLKWMAFAIDETGDYGHGVDMSKRRAEDLALRYCGSNCRIIDTAVAKCHALAHSKKGGYWYGVAYDKTRYGARKSAIRFCTKGAPTNTCKVKYDYCQP